MRLVTIPPGVLLLMSALACARTPAVDAPAPSGPSVWTADFTRTKPGQLERYLRAPDNPLEQTVASSVFTTAIDEFHDHRAESV